MRKSALSALLAASLALVASYPASATDTSKTQKVSLAGRAFDYSVAGYHICINFAGEDSLRWIYLAAPGDKTGQTATTTFDRRDIRSNVVLLAWTEESGANVTDVFDFSEMALHASFVMPNGKRFMSDADLTERSSCDA